MIQSAIVCVCTYKRPKLLEDCLVSLSAQAPCDDVALKIAIIDNDAAETARAIVANTGQNFLYTVEPKRGIAAVRNAALALATKVGADWVVFIDDDEIADKFWFRELMSPEYRSVPILRGLRILVRPDPPPFWSVEQRKSLPPEGRTFHTAYTHNVRFSRALIDSGLRFDETLALTGGEDVDFFARAYRSGFEIRHTNR